MKFMWLISYYKISKNLINWLIVNYLCVDKWKCDLEKEIQTNKRLKFNFWFE